MDSNDYKRRHFTAMAGAQLTHYGTLLMSEVQKKINAQRRHEVAIAAMVKGLAEYAYAYNAAYGSNLASDHVLGEYWETIAHALRGLLNGEIGRLDGGLTDKAICEALESAGFNPDVQGKVK